MHTTSPAPPSPAPWLLLALAGALWSCGDKDDPADDTAGTTDDTGSSDSVEGLPEGSSSWTGNMEAAGFPFLFEVDIVNTGGDLTATATFTDDPEDPSGIGGGTFTLQGTHSPESGLVALAPTAWVDPPDIEVELVGLEATWDPEARTLTGTVADYASGTNNTLSGGPLSATLVSGDGAPSTLGDEGASLADGELSFSGTMQCTSDPREVVATLTHDGTGGLSGQLTIGDPGLDDPLGVMEFTGVHNPTTGGITLVPGLWVDPDHTILAFFIDGTYDPATGAFTGDQLTNVAACPAGTWSVSF